METNPVAAEKHAKIVQLENQLKQVTVATNNNSSSVAIDSVLKLTEQALRALADYKVDISFL